MSGIYEETFAGVKQPVAVHTAVTGRINLERAFTHDLAAYFHERAQVEEQYIKSLTKLATKLQDRSSNNEVDAVLSLAGTGTGDRSKETKVQLGAWYGIRSQLEREVNELSRVHDTWRKRITEEVADPIRRSTSKAPWTTWDQSEAQVQSTVKEYDSTLDKVQKSQTKSSKSASSKLLNNQSQLSTLGSSLTAALPTFLSQSQALEETHSAFLKEALVRAGTCTSDLGRERMEAGERLLNAVLGIDDQVEMQTWALRESMRAARQASSTPAVAGAGGDMTEFGGGASVREESILEEPSQFSASGRDDQRVPAISRTGPPPAAPLPLPTASPSKKDKKGKEKSGGFKSLFKRGGDKSGSANSAKYGNLSVPGNNGSNDYGSSARDRQSVDSRDSESINVPEDATGTGRPGVNRAPSTNSDLLGGSGSGLPEPIMPMNRARGASASSGSKKRDSLMPFAGGNLFRRGSKMTPSQTSGSPQFERRESDLGYQQQEQYGSESASAQPAFATSAVDEEGYSVPPAGYDRQIGETERANANLMDDDDEDDDVRSASLPPIASSRVPNVALAPAAITESEAERQAALDRVKSTLLSSSSSGSASNLARRQTRGRRDVRMTTYSPTIPDDVPLAKVIEQQRAREASGSDNGIAQHRDLSQSSGGMSPIGSGFGGPGRAMSMLSAHSAGGRVGAGADPFEHATTPGLRAAITETVNVLSKGGEIQRVMITGEIALSYRKDPTSGGYGQEDNLRIRIANYEQFEKAAPNSAYLSQIADAPGEYMILPSLLANSNSHTATVLKYQLHVDAGSERSFVPLQVKAMWKCEPSQTKIIVTYSGNRTARLAEREQSPFGSADDDDDYAPQIKLEDVSFSVAMSTGVTTFQAKPPAEWSPDKARLTFTVDPVSLGGVQQDEEKKLLAMIATDGTAVAQPVAVKWRAVGATVSRVGIELVGGGGAQQQVDEIVRTSVSGKYLVAP